MACALAAGTAPLPGGRIFATGHWLVEHCVGPLGLGTLVVKPERHVTAVADLSEAETGELGPLLRLASAVARRLAGADVGPAGAEVGQVYNCLWSHSGGRPGHIHYVVQPVTTEQVARLGARGPALQAAMFAAGDVPGADEVERVAAHARGLFAKMAPGPAAGMAGDGGLRPETTAAVTAARRALGLARDGAASARVSAKAGRDVVTSSDVAAEDLIREILSRATPAAVIGEERGGAPPADGSAYWLVDPICGTRNYASGTPLWCVNLALVEGGVVTAAVVADASTGHVYAAERGRGAWDLDGAPPRRLAATASSRTVVVSVGKSGGERRARAARFVAAVIEADEWDVRMVGSSLSLLHAAAGRAAAAVECYAGGLHTAAGVLIAAEAGAVVSDVEGRAWTPESDSAMASASPGLHHRLLSLTRE